MTLHSSTCDGDRSIVRNEVQRVIGGVTPEGRFASASRLVRVLPIREPRAEAWRACRLLDISALGPGPESLSLEAEESVDAVVTV
jgi:hypothetical protein